MMICSASQLLTAAAGGQLTQPCRLIYWPNAQQGSLIPCQQVNLLIIWLEQREGDCMPGGLVKSVSTALRHFLVTKKNLQEVSAAGLLVGYLQDQINKHGGQRRAEQRRGRGGCIGVFLSHHSLLCVGSEDYVFSHCDHNKIPQYQSSHRDP